MKNISYFYKLDYLIYSSHKTSTQSLLRSLRNNFFRVLHCHLLNDLSLFLKNFKTRHFKKYLNIYLKKNKKNSK